MLCADINAYKWNNFIALTSRLARVFLLGLSLPEKKEVKFNSRSGTSARARNWHFSLGSFLGDYRELKTDIIRLCDEGISGIDIYIDPPLWEVGEESREGRPGPSSGIVSCKFSSLWMSPYLEHNSYQQWVRFSKRELKLMIEAHFR